MDDAGGAVVAAALPRELVFDGPPTAADVVGGNWVVVQPTIGSGTLPAGSTVEFTIPRGAAQAIDTVMFEFTVTNNNTAGDTNAIRAPAYAYWNRITMTTPQGGVAVDTMNAHRLAHLLYSACSQDFVDYPGSIMMGTSSDPVAVASIAAGGGTRTFTMPILSTLFYWWEKAFPQAVMDEELTLRLVAAPATEAVFKVGSDNATANYGISGCRLHLRGVQLSPSRVAAMLSARAAEGFFSQTTEWTVYTANCLAGALAQVYNIPFNGEVLSVVFGHQAVAPATNLRVPILSTTIHNNLGTFQFRRGSEVFPQQPIPAGLRALAYRHLNDVFGAVGDTLRNMSITGAQYTSTASDLNAAATAPAKVYQGYNFAKMGGRWVGNGLDTTGADSFELLASYSAAPVASTVFIFVLHVKKIMIMPDGVLRTMN